MIFITVGSQKFQFNRLLRAVDQLIDSGDIREDVFAQSGACDYVPLHYKSQPFIDREMYNSTMDKCDLVITHGGTGAILGALKAGKRVIAVPRLTEYGEHVDNHQKQLIDEFTKANFICSCENLDHLREVIRETKDKIFNVYESNTDEYIRVIDDYISEL